jgi:DNA polymerase-3 subunit delta
MIQVFYSSQSRMVKGAAKKVIKATFPERNPLNYVSLDMGVTTLEELAYECTSLPLGYDKKAVVAENCFFLEKRKSSPRLLKGDNEKAFLKFLDSPDPNINLYLLVYSDILDEKGKFYPLLLKAGATLSAVAEFTPSQWQIFIPSFFAKRGIKIDSDAANELLNRTEGNYGNFLNEAGKLVCYANKSLHISLDDIKALVLAPLDDDAFHLSNALCRGDVKKAFHIYRDLEKQNIEEVYLIHTLANQFRYLNQVLYLSKNGKDENEISTLLHCSNARTRVSLANLRRMNDETCAKALNSLYQTEKAILSGEKSAPLAFSLFLTNFSL